MDADDVREVVDRLAPDDLIRWVLDRLDEAFQDGYDSALDDHPALAWDPEDEPSWWEPPRAVVDVVVSL